MSEEIPSSENPIISYPAISCILLLERGQNYTVQCEVSLFTLLKFAVHKVSDKFKPYAVQN